MVRAAMTEPRSPAFSCKRFLSAPALAIAVLAGCPAALQAQSFTASEVVVDRAVTQRICQVTGEVDRATGRRTVNATETRFKFRGTDLGASFEHQGRLVFLFGDTHPVRGIQRLPDRDLIAFSSDEDPEDCLALDVPLNPDGGYRALAIPKVDGGGFSVPTAGFSAGGAIYVVATTDRRHGNPMNRSVLASSTDGGHSFHYEYDLSTRHFINVAAASVDSGEVLGLPPGTGRAVLLWGSGRYRKSDPHLAVIPEAGLGSRKSLRYFAGLDGATGEPIWSAREADSAALFHQPCLGELSVAWNADLGKWVMLYNCGNAGSKIYFRTADQPWGQWSSPEVLFDPRQDAGFCRFMNASARTPAASSDEGCPRIADAGTPFIPGDPYAPYLIAKFARGVPGSQSDIYFLMSTWNPYNVVLMKARLKLRSRPEVRQASVEDELGS